MNLRNTIAAAVLAIALGLLSACSSQGGLSAAKPSSSGTGSSTAALSAPPPAAIAAFEARTYHCVSLARLSAVTGLPFSIRSARKDGCLYDAANASQTVPEIGLAATFPFIPPTGPWNVQLARQSLANPAGVYAISNAPAFGSGAFVASTPGPGATCAVYGPGVTVWDVQVSVYVRTALGGRNPCTVAAAAARILLRHIP